MNDNVIYLAAELEQYTNRELMQRWINGLPLTRKQERDAEVLVIDALQKALEQ